MNLLTMNRFKLIVCFLMLFFIRHSTQAQSFDFRLGSDIIVEDATKDAIVIVKSQYCIQDVENNQKYGRNGKPYFNILQFIGCKTDKGIITSKEVLAPWTVDNSFDKYRNNSKYKPLLDSDIHVASSREDTCVTINLASNLLINGDSTLICVENQESITDAITLSLDNVDALNWFVWVKNAKEKDSQVSSNLKYSIVRQTVDLSGGDVYVEAPNVTGSYLGGIYVSAKVVSVGLVEFSLSGFIVKDSGRWKVEPINTDFFTLLESGEENEIKSPDTENPEDGLTPLSDKKPKKKAKKK